jgi:hypothetical protein
MRAMRSEVRWPVRIISGTGLARDGERRDVCGEEEHQKVVREILARFQLLRLCDLHATTCDFADKDDLRTRIRIRSQGHSSVRRKNEK